LIVAAISPMKTIMLTEIINISSQSPIPSKGSWSCLIFSVSRYELSILFLLLWTNRSD